ncbi:MAG: Flp pilus assembly complex ATPase component TadA, partial [Planctomycetaceae bacterium]|nr:Flp pilus assembly complex ATPase component TadA [Planctomycetaceae bacterium]
EYRFLSDLKLPTTIADSLKSLLQRTSGLLLVCGPAGSGKTTTLYAAFREIQKGGFEFRSLCTLEDPVEAILPGVSQSQVKPDGDFNYHRGLASLLRQDPEVIMVGEIRDPQTAQVVFQASMTGHLVLSSFHAGRAADAVSRLADMRVEPYVLRTGLLAILAQRLLRRTCSCRRHDTGGCRDCHQTGYRGRLVVAEMLQCSSVDIANAILRREDARRIQELAVATGMVPLRTVAENLVEQGLTTSDEVIRVFGIE